VTKRSCPGTSTKPETHAGFFEESKTEVDSDAAALFLFEAVGMRAGQRLDEGGFSVVDVAGGADDDALKLVGHAFGLSCSSNGNTRETSI